MLNILVKRIRIMSIVCRCHLRVHWSKGIGISDRSRQTTTSLRERFSVENFDLGLDSGREGGGGGDEGPGHDV